MTKLQFISLSLGLLLSTNVLSNTSADLTIQDVRTYHTGFVVKVASPINTSCTYPDHLQLYLDNVTNYNASVSLFMTAWAQGKKIRAIYNGCGPNQDASGGGNVYVSGWIVIE